MKIDKLVKDGVLDLPKIVGGKVRAEVGNLYSAYLLPTSLTKGDYQLFSTNVGATGQGSTTNALTYVETNMENNGRIPDSTSWVISDLGIGFNTSISLADSQKILNASYLTFTKPGYVRTLGPCLMWPAGWGISGTTTANARETYSNGFPALRMSRRSLSTPIVLNHGTTFNFTVSVGNAGYSTQTLDATSWIWVSLWGVRIEAIAQ